MQSVAKLTARRSNNTEKLKEAGRQAYSCTTTAVGLERTSEKVDSKYITETKIAVTKSWNFIRKKKDIATQKVTKTGGRVVSGVGSAISNATHTLTNKIDDHKNIATVVDKTKNLLKKTRYVVAVAIDSTKHGIVVASTTTAKAIADKVFDDWEEEGTYEPPRIINLPDKSKYFLSVDEKQQGDNLVSRFFIKLGLEQKQFTRELARVVVEHNGNILELLTEEHGIDDVRDDLGGFTLLQIAILIDNFEICQELINRGATATKQNAHGHSPLHMAIMVEGSHLFEIVHLLLDNGADVVAKDKDKNTVLHWVGQTSQVDLYNLLVDRGAPLDILDGRCRTELFQPVLHRQPKMLQAMLQRGANHAAIDPWGRTAIHFAAALGDVEICEILIEKDATFINQEDGYLWGPVFYAASEGQLETLKLFIEKYNVSPHLSYPVSTWRSSGAFWLKKYVLPAGDILIGGALFAKRLMTAKEDRNNASTILQEERYDMNLLHRAAMRGHVDACNYLLDLGMDPNCQQHTILRTPLHLACAEGHPQVAELLLSRGANVDAKDKYNFTPLHLSCLGDHYLYVELKPRNVTQGNIECARILLSAGADPDARVTTRMAPPPFSKGSEIALYGTQGCTPLHFATMKGEVALVKMLLKEGADPEIKSLLVTVTYRSTVQFSGQSPLYLATCLRGEIYYYDDYTVTFGGVLKKAVVYEITPHAMFALRGMYQKMGNKYPRIEGMAFETGLNHYFTKQMLITSSIGDWQQRVFQLGIETLKVYEYTLGLELNDTTLASISRRKQIITVEPLENHLGRTHCISISATNRKTPDQPAPPFVMAFKTKTAQQEWIRALRVRLEEVHSEQADDPLVKYRKAVSKGDFEQVREILQNGVDPNCVLDQYGATGLHIAACSGHFRVVEELLAFGADPNAQDYEGQTPLHTASFWSDVARSDLPFWLCSTQAYWGRYDAKQVNNMGKRTGIAYLLLQWGADKDAKNNEGLTPFDLARDYLMKYVTFHGKIFASNWLYYYVSTGLKGWNRYWAVLTTDTIFLFNEAPKAKVVEGEVYVPTMNWVGPDNFIKLEGARVQLHLQKPMRRNAFEIITEGGVTKVLSVSEKISEEHEALLHRWIERIQRRIDILSNPNAIPNFINPTITILNEMHEAAEEGDTSKLRQLIGEQKRDPNYQRSKDGRTPLHVAAAYNQIEAVETLLSLKANPVEEDKRGWTPVHVAAWFNNVDILALLLQKVASGRHWSDMTPLHRAAEANSVESIEFLLSKYGKMFGINAQEQLYGDTPLHLAARLGNEAAVDVLIKHGANRSIENDSNKTASECAATIPIKKKLEPIFNYVRCDDIIKVQEVLQKDASIAKKRDFQNTTLTHVAAEEGALKVLRHMITLSKEYIEIKAGDGSTPLHVAARAGKLESVELLLKFQASVNASNFKKDTPLHLAVKYGHKDVCSMLFSNGADMEAPNVNMQTPMTLDTRNILKQLKRASEMPTASLSSPPSFSSAPPSQRYSVIEPEQKRKPLPTLPPIPKGKLPTPTQSPTQSPTQKRVQSSYRLSQSVSLGNLAKTANEGMALGMRSLERAKTGSGFLPRTGSLIGTSSVDNYNSGMYEPTAKESQTPISFNHNQPLNGDNYRTNAYAPTSSESPHLIGTRSMNRLPSIISPRRENYKQDVYSPDVFSDNYGSSLYAPTNEEHCDNYGSNVYAPTKSPETQRQLPSTPPPTGDNYNSGACNPNTSPIIRPQPPSRQPPSTPPPTPGENYKSDMYSPTSHPPLRQPPSTPPTPGENYKSDVYAPTSPTSSSNGSGISRPQPPLRQPPSTPPPIPGNNYKPDVYSPTSSSNDAGISRPQPLRQPPSAPPPIPKEQKSGPKRSASLARVSKLPPPPAPPSTADITTETNVSRPPKIPPPQPPKAIRQTNSEPQMTPTTPPTPPTPSKTIITVHLEERGEKTALYCDPNQTVADVVTSVWAKRNALVNAEDYSLAPITKEKDVLNRNCKMSELNGTEFFMVSTVKRVNTIYNTSAHDVKVKIVDLEEDFTIPYSIDLTVGTVLAAFCENRNLPQSQYYVTLGGSIAALNIHDKLRDIPKYRQHLELHRSDITQDIRQKMKIETKFTSSFNTVTLPEDFKKKYVNEYLSESPSALLRKVKEALMKYDIFDDEDANLENSSVNAAFGMLFAGGALAPSVAIFPLMFPEVQGTLSIKTKKVKVSNAWVALGRLEKEKKKMSKTADFLIGYKSPLMPPSENSGEKKQVEATPIFYIAIEDIESIQERTKGSKSARSFYIYMKDKRKIRVKASESHEAAAWTRLLFGSVLAKRNWNEEFQQLVDEGLGWPDNYTTMDRQKMLNESFGKLVREFTALASVLTTIIVAERWILKGETRLIAPEDDSGAGGQKFKTHNMYIKFAVSDDVDYYHSDEEQAKAAELELKSLNAYLNYAAKRSSKARFPLMSMFDYRGLRLTATPVLPLHEIIYGSDDRGESIHASVPEFNETMKELGESFNIKPHFVFSHQAKRELNDNLEKYTSPPYAAEIYGCGDIEGHLGKDGRYYLLDTARLFPPAGYRDARGKNGLQYVSSEQNSLYFEFIKGGFLCRMLRPEFMQAYDQPLNSDVFCGWSINPLNPLLRWEEEEEVIIMTQLLERELLPNAGDAMSQFYEEILKSQNVDKTELLREIIVDIHSKGINVRYLGLLRQYITLPDLSNLILNEMVCRVIKSWMNLRMRALQNTDFIAHQNLICSMFNDVFITPLSRSNFWKEYLEKQLIHKFGEFGCLNETPETIHQQMQWEVLFNRIQHFTQILFEKDAITKLNKREPFAKTDLRTSIPRAKHLFCVAKQIASYALERNKTVEGNSFIKVKLGHAIHNIRPQWNHVLSKWLEAVERSPSDGEAICSWVESHIQFRNYLIDETEKLEAKSKAISTSEEIAKQFNLLKPYAISYANDAHELEAKSLIKWTGNLNDYTHENMRFQLAVNVEGGNPIIMCRYANFCYIYLGDLETAKVFFDYAVESNVINEDPRVKLYVEAFEHYKASFEKTSNPLEMTKAVRKKNLDDIDFVKLGAMKDDDYDNKVQKIVDPLLVKHKLLIDQLCFEFVCKSPPFKIVPNEAIGVCRDARVAIQRIIKQTRFLAKIKQQDEIGLTDCVEIPFGRNHAVDFGAPKERGKRDWIGCFPVLQGNEAEEEKLKKDLKVCDVHHNVFKDKKKLFILDYVGIELKDDWQQVPYTSKQEGVLGFPKKKKSIAEKIKDKAVGEEEMNSFPEGVYEYRYYRMKADILLLLEYAQSFLRVDNFAAASLFFKQALDMAPANVDLTVAYARFLMLLVEKMKTVTGANKQFHDGIKEYWRQARKIVKRGLKLNPLHISSLLVLGELYLNRDNKMSTKYAEKALKEDPYNVHALRILSASAVGAKRVAAADKYFRNALTLNSSDVDMLIAYGMLNNDAKDYDKCEGLFSKALILYPENTELLAAYYDVVLSGTNNRKKMWHVINLLLELEPNNPEHYIRKAKFLWQYTGDVDAVDEELIKACELDSGVASVQLRVAFLREVRDDVVEANKLQREAIFQLDYRNQEEWEEFVRNDNRAFISKYKILVGKLKTMKQMAKWLPLVTLLFKKPPQWAGYVL